MSETASKLLAAASCASAASCDLIEAVRDDNPPMGNVAAGETATALADALRLVLDVMACAPDGPGEAETQLHGALVRFLEDLS